jgi:hypothetical protein
MKRMLSSTILCKEEQMGTMNKLKKYILPLMLTALVIMMAACTGDTNNVSTGSNVVAGTLRDATTGAPIAGALIKSSWSSSTTDATGNWNLGVPANITNSGATTLDPGSYVVSISTANVTSPTPKPAYPATAFRVVTGSGTTGPGGANALTVGATTATVTGRIVSPAGTALSGATVRLIDTVSGTVVLGTGTTIADGTFSITGIEQGASFIVTAVSADGLSALAVPAGPFIAGQTAFLGTLATTANQDTTLTLKVAAPIVVTQGTTTINTSVDVTAGVATTVTFNFSRPAKLSAYASSTAPGGALYNDVSVNFAARSGNVSGYTVALVGATTTSFTGIAVTFTPAAASIYTISIAAVMPKLVDLNGVIGSAAASTASFSTGGANVIATAPVVTRVAGTLLGDLGVNWTPVLNAKGDTVYVQKSENGVTTDFFPYGDSVGGAFQKHIFPNGTLALNVATTGGFFFTSSPPGTAGAAGVVGGAASTFLGFLGAPYTITPFYNGINVAFYNLKVVPVDADNAEIFAQTSNVIKLDDKTLVEVSTTAKPAGAVVVTAAKAAAAAQVFTGTFFVAGAEPTVTLSYWANPSLGNPPFSAGAGLTGADTVPEQMIAATVAAANFGIVSNGGAAVNMATLTATSGPTALTVGTTPATCVLNVISAVYNASNQTTALKYNITWTLAVPAAAGPLDVAGTTYTVTPNAYLFTNALATDLNGNLIKPTIFVAPATVGQGF